MSVMRTICWDVNGFHAPTIRNLIRREGSDLGIAIIQITCNLSNLCPSLWFQISVFTISHPGQRRLPLLVDYKLACCCWLKHFQFIIVKLNDLKWWFLTFTVVFMPYTSYVLYRGVICLAADSGPVIQHGGKAGMSVRASALLVHCTLCLMWEMSASCILRMSTRWLSAII